MSRRTADNKMLSSHFLYFCSVSCGLCGLMDDRQLRSLRLVLAIIHAVCARAHKDNNSCLGNGTFDASLSQLWESFAIACDMIGADLKRIMTQQAREQPWYVIPVWCFLTSFFFSTSLHVDCYPVMCNEYPENTVLAIEAKG